MINTTGVTGYNGIPTNVDAELKGSATPEDIVRIVVRP